MKSAKAILSAILILAFLPAFMSCQQRTTGALTDTENMQSPKITSLARGNHSGIEKSRQLVINSYEEWRNLWKEIHRNRYPVPKVPEVDFSRETVLAVFMGTRSSGGYNVEITGITEKQGVLEAKVRTHTPEPGEIVTTVLTQPFHIVKVNVASENIRFLEE